MPLSLWVRSLFSLYDLQHNLSTSQNAIVYLKPSLRVAGYITAVPLFDNLLTTYDCSNV